MPGQPLQSGVSKEDPDSLQRARPRRGWEKATLKEMALGRGSHRVTAVPLTFLPPSPGGEGLVRSQNRNIPCPSALLAALTLVAMGCQG